MYNLLSFLIGAITSFMLSINGILSLNVGNYLSIVIIHLVGLCVMLLILLFKRNKFHFDRKISFLWYSGGAIGIFTVICNNIGINTIGATLSISLGLLGQVLASIIIDHFGFFGVKKSSFNRKKIFGLSLMIIGIFIMIAY